MRQSFILVAILLSALVVISGCAKNTTPAVQDKPVENAPVKQIEERVPKTVRTSTTLTADFFNPPYVDVNVGDTVVVEIMSVDVDHIVVAPSINQQETILVGKTASFTIPVTRDLTVLSCIDNCKQNITFSIKGK